MNNFLFFSLYNLAHQSKFLDGLIVFFAEYLPYFAVLFILIYIFYRNIGDFDWRKPFFIIRERFEDFSRIFFPAISAWIVAYILKEIFSSPRPFILFKEKVEPLFLHGGMDSFPSGHATFFAALALSVFLVDKKVGWVYILIAVIIGFARVISGVHFPIDIIFGYLLGIATVFTFKLIFRTSRTGAK